MKDKIQQSVTTKIQEYKTLEDYKKSNFPDFKSLDKVSKVKLGSVLVKQMNLVIEVNCLSELFKDLFQEAISIPEDFDKEAKQFRNSISSIKVENGEIKYNKEIEELLNKANGENLQI